MTDQASWLSVTRRDLTRRSFLKWSAVAGGTLAASGAGWKLGLSPLEAKPDSSAGVTAAAGDGAKMVWSSCNVNCGSRCPLRLLVENGQITRVEPDDTGDDLLGDQQIRACLRGRSIRKRIYSPDRLKYPMKRVGARGEGKFTRISWEEAYDTIADSLKQTIAKYGNEAVWINYGTGTIGGTLTSSWPPGGTLIARLMNLVGGSLNQYGDYSAAQIEASVGYFYGGWVSSNSFDDIANSRLVLLWGNSPQQTRMSGGGESYVIEQAVKASNARVIIVDPIYSDTAVTLADEWVPLRPGTDPALIAGMAYVMITENLHDQAFLDRYTLGFDEEHMPAGVPAGSSYKSYVLGDGPDRTPKTPEWAARISGVPAGNIIQLAREIALTKPCSITQGWGPQRHFNGDATSRAIMLLAAITGNVGIHGGGTGCREGDYALPMAVMPIPSNPVKATISFFGFTEAIERGTEMTALADGVQGVERLNAPIKFIWQYAGNALVNQHAEINRTREILADTSKCEMIVVIDNQMTVSARFADILLPDVSNAEQMDLIQQGAAGNLGYTILASQAIEPLFESKTIYEMCSEIAKRLSVEQQFTEGRTQEEWVRWLIAESQKAVPGLPGFEELAAMGIWRQETTPDHTQVALQSFREDPEKNPLGTPSGKIEIFSKQLWELNRTWELPKGQQISAIPSWYEYPECATDRLRETYPLQCIGHHYKARTHSTYGNVDWLKEAAPQMVWINTADAESRGIANGDSVYVYNARGRLQIVAKVTSRIAPGVISVPEGAWYTPDATGTDTGGCVNILTVQRPTPLAKGNPQHTNLTEVVKV
ncbi:MAG TPA: DMSO/selenate family reductase complex A subunit [Acidimicrobiales bacterium]|nr:DMSO/selenate family reductase complex A subunit [Acidimicrobiales bacterium]